MKTEEELLNRMQAYCARTEHCRSEVAAKLRRAGTDELMIERLLQRLVEDRFMRIVLPVLMLVTNTDSMAGAPSALLRNWPNGAFRIRSSVRPYWIWRREKIR